MIRRSLFLVLLSIGNSGFSYLTQLLLGRLLSPSDYSAYNALGALGTFFMAALGVINLASVRKVVALSGEPSRLRDFVHGTGLSVLAVSGGLAFGAGLGIPWLEKSLKIGEPASILLYLAVFVLTTVALFYRSVLQGLGRYFEFTALYCLYSLALLALAPLLLLGFSSRPFWAFAASGGAAAIAMGVTAAMLARDRRFGGWLPRTLRFRWPALGDLAGVGVATLILTGFTNLDLPVAKGLFTPEEAGQFTGAAIIARIAFLLPGILPSILFPEVIRMQSQGKGSLKHLLSALSFTAALSGAFAAATWIWPERALSLLLGPSYLAGAPVLRIHAVSMGIWAVNSLFLHFFSAKGLLQGVGGAFVVGSGALAAALTWRAPGVSGLATAWLLASSAVLAFSLGFCGWVAFPRKSRSRAG